MLAVRLHEPGGLASLVVEEVDAPEPSGGEALVRVHAAALTRDELDWPVDRLPAIPSYELSGTVEAVGPGVETVTPGDRVYALTPFDRDGAAAELVATPAGLLAPKPAAISDVEAAALPLAGLSARQGLVDHGRLESGQRVLILGGAGGVGHLAVQLAKARGAYVIATASAASAEAARTLGADEVLDPGVDFAGSLEPVDLVFDTTGGDVLIRAAAATRPGGRVVSVAEEPPGDGVYFVVVPDRAQLVELARLADRGELRPAIDSTFPLAEARSAFERVQAGGKAGKVVLRV